MNTSVYHSLSPSEDEEITEIDEKPKPKPTIQSTDVFNEILSKVCGVPYDYDQLIRSNEECILFSDDINDDDEIWLMQTPRDVNLNAFHDVNMEFNSSISKMTLRSHKKKKKYSVYTIPCTDQICSVLPKRKTRSFDLNVFSLTGRILLQEQIRMKNTRESELPSDEVKVKTEIDDVPQFYLNRKMKRERNIRNSIPATFGSTIVDSKENKPKEKRKRKST